MMINFKVLPVFIFILFTVSFAFGQDEKVWFEKGLASIDDGDYKKAVECFDEAIKINPSYGEAWYKKGVAIYKSGGSSEDELYCYNKAISLKNSCHEAIYAKGWFLYERGNILEAANLYCQAVNIFPSYEWYGKIDEKRADYWFLEGKKCELLDDSVWMVDAIKYYNKAIEINPDFVWAWIEKGRCEGIKGDIDTAFKCFHKALDLDPKNTYPLVYKGKLLFYTDPDGAIACYDRAIEMEPRNPYLWELESQLYFYMDKYEDVIICCDKALRLDSENVFSLSCKGKALYHLERFEEALECFNEYLKLVPGDNDEITSFRDECLTALRGHL